MRHEYRFTHRKGRYIQVMFSHIPGRWFSTGTEDMAEAVRWADRKIAVDTGKVREAGALTLRDFAQGFFTDDDPRGFRHRQLMRNARFDATYYRKKQSQLDNYILKAHGDYLLTGISDVLIEDFILDLRNFRTHRALASDTKNKILMTYSDVMREAKRQGFIAVNPCDGVQSIMTTSEERQPFTEQELDLFFPMELDRLEFIWGSLQWAVYFAIQKDTGFRPSEVSGLTKANYYPEFHGLYTTASVDSATGLIKQSIKTTKKGQKYKDGFLSDQTADLIEKLIATTRDEYLFRARNGAFIIPNTANKHLEASAVRAGVRLNGRTQYSFRHSFQTYYIGRMPELARLILMGHTRTRTEYTHLTPEQSLQRVLSIEGVREALSARGKENLRS